MLADKPVGHSSIRVRAPAKLNLFLELLAKRSDGYHEVETLMVPVSLYDTVHFSDAPLGTASNTGPVRFFCQFAVPGRFSDSATDAVAPQIDTIPVGSGNMVVQAVELLRTRSGCDRHATVRLVKRIPTEAGMGGGSSDAAAALLAANHVWRLRWSCERLAELASELGSDVPFFLRKQPAVGRGRGERLETVTGLGDLHAVIVRPPAGLSTAEVYGACEVPRQPRQVEPLIGALRANDPRAIRRHLCNRLQDPASRLSPWIDRAVRAMATLDVAAHQMTGSGSAVFGVCRNARHAKRIAAQLRARGWDRVFQVRRAFSTE